MTMDLEDSGDMALSITLASKKAARRFTLMLANYGSRVTGFSTARARAPRERRIYPAQAELFALLASETPSGLDYECGSAFLGGLETGVALDPMDYYVVEDRHSGWAASSALASALANVLEGGLDLVSVEESENESEGSSTDVQDSASSGRAIEFSFAAQPEQTAYQKAGHKAGQNKEKKAGQNKSRIIHVELDHRDRVVAVEVRRIPHVYPWQVYSRSAELLKSLESRAAISRISLAGDEGGSVILDGQLVIDLADFAVGDIECPC